MKKNLLLPLVFSIILLSQSAFAGNSIKHASAKEIVLSTADQARVREIEARILQIKAMDKSQLSHQQRKEIRKELSQIKKEMKGFTSGGVYLSVAAIIIIVLVLILIV